MDPGKAGRAGTIPASLSTSTPIPSLRAFFILGRVSNLPTVWSNCLAGWWLGGGGNVEQLPFLFVGATLLYVGGMFLNDAFDIEFDRQHRMERPIPSGAIGLSAVWHWGLACLTLGALSLVWLGRVTGEAGLALAFCIIVYDAAHKLIAFAPALMGLCRLLLYVIAASTARAGVTGWSLWCGLALAAYIVGLSCLARGESAPSPLRHWPVFLLGFPIILALIMNANDHRQAALLLSAVLGLWVCRSLRHTLWTAETQIGRTVSGLLAGIVFVDWLAVADAPRNLSLLFLGLFFAAVLFQKFVPAT